MFCRCGRDIDDDALADFLDNAVALRCDSIVEVDGSDINWMLSFSSEDTSRGSIIPLLPPLSFLRCFFPLPFPLPLERDVLSGRNSSVSLSHMCPDGAELVANVCCWLVCHWLLEWGFDEEFFCLLFNLVLDCLLPWSFLLCTSLLSVPSESEDSFCTVLYSLLRPLLPLLLDCLLERKMC